MRFKCVSRIWRSIITNPSFAAAYRGGSRGLLLCHPGSYLLLSLRSFYFAPLDGSPTSQLSFYHTVDHGGVKMGSTGIVNGLICFFDRNRSWLYNIATRESLRLPVSKNESQACNYQLGFDPINKLYKLLKICPVYNPPYDDKFPGYQSDYFVKNLNCEILTIGMDSSWRIVDSIPPMAIEQQGVCIEGILYWIARIASVDRLIAFHLIEEKFEVTFLPECGFDVPSGLYLPSGFYLPRFGPSLAVSQINVFDWTSEASFIRYRKGKGGGGEWSDVLRFVLSSEGETYHRMVEGILPNGKLVITEMDYGAPRSTLFLFDPTIKGEYEKIVVVPSQERFSTVVAYVGTDHHEDDGDRNNNIINHRMLDYFDGFYDRSSYYEENILPLRCLTC